MASGDWATTIILVVLLVTFLIIVVSWTCFPPYERHYAHRHNAYYTQFRS